MEDMLDYIEHLQIMRLQPNDILVITVDNNCTEHQNHLIMESINKTLKANNYDNEILMKTRDIEFQILRKEDISDEEH